VRLLHVIELVEKSLSGLPIAGQNRCLVVSVAELFEFELSAIIVNWRHEVRQGLALVVHVDEDKAGPRVHFDPLEAQFFIGQLRPEITAIP